MSPGAAMTEPTSPEASEQHLLSLCAATTEAHAPRACALQQEKPLQWEARGLQQRVVPAQHNWRRAGMQPQRPSATKNK